MHFGGRVKQDVEGLDSAYRDLENLPDQDAPDYYRCHTSYTTDVCRLPFNIILDGAAVKAVEARRIPGRNQQLMRHRDGRCS